VILRIARRSSAHRLGLQRGDVVLQIAEQPIMSVAQLKDSLFDLPATWRIEIDRGGRRLGVTIGQ